MRIIKSVKKRVIGLEVFLLTTSTKVFAFGIDRTPLVYGPPESNQENIESIELKSKFSISKVLLIPIILLIGIIIYLKKSKSNKKRKLITVLIAIAIVVALEFYIMNVI